MFENLIEKLKKNPTTLVFTEGTDARILEAASRLKKNGILEPLLIGVPEEVQAAAKKARCYDFIMALPNGFDTVIGEGGATLSGGERQRISIARAIMKDAPIIILDEATANVDPENEKELMEAVAELTHDKTVIMIAHRLKTVRGAEQILVLQNGRIVQNGTHDQLAGQEGLYARLWELQNQAGNYTFQQS